MRLDYGKLIKESDEALRKLEKRHRYSHLMQRVRMLRLLKTGECRSLTEAAAALGYSRRQCQRWLDSYRAGGLAALLENRIAQRGRREWVDAEAWSSLQAALKRGEIATYKQARGLLAEHGVHYKDETGVLRLFRRHQIKLKTGRPRHEKADPEAQESFKKTLLNT